MCCNGVCCGYRPPASEVQFQIKFVFVKKKIIGIKQLSDRSRICAVAPRIHQHDELSKSENQGLVESGWSVRFRFRSVRQVNDLMCCLVMASSALKKIDELLPLMTLIEFFRNAHE